MFRTVALMVVLTHLGVASAPCCDAGYAPPRLPILAASDAHAAHHAPSPPVEEATRPAEHAHHLHGHEDSQAAAAQARAEVEAAKAAQFVRAEIRAVCLCGCSTNTNSPGTTTSPRLGFALLPLAPPRLVEAELSVGVQRKTPLPVAVPDPLEHVPILSS